jgi:hypothetical protein
MKQSIASLLRLAILGALLVGGAWFNCVTPNLTWGSPVMSRAVSVTTPVTEVTDQPTLNVPGDIQNWDCVSIIQEANGIQVYLFQNPNSKAPIRHVALMVYQNRCIAYVYSELSSTLVFYVLNPATNSFVPDAESQNDPVTYNEVAELFNQAFGISIAQKLSI